MFKGTAALSDHEFLEELEDIYVRINGKGKKNNRRKDKKSILKERKKEDSLPYLPENIIFDILTRLPAELLYEKFRYICKAWYGMISSSKFAAQNAPRNESGLLIQIETSRYYSYKTKLLEMDELELVYNVRDFVIYGGGRVTSSCDGMLLMNGPEPKNVLNVVNPLTGLMVTLPKSPTSCLHYNCGLALGYNPFTEEYKVVHIDFHVCVFEKFTLGCSDGAWKQIPCLLLKEDWHFDLVHWDDICSINGQVLHWRVNSFPYLLSMDLIDESIRRTHFPGCGKRVLEHEYALLEMGGYLSFIHNVSSSQIDIWILKDFHEQVWFKRHAIMTELINYTNLKDHSLPSRLPDFKKLLPIAGLRNGEVIVFMHETDSRLYLYEINHRELRKFIMKILKRDAYFVPHRSSLIWWKTGNKSLP